MRMDAMIRVRDMGRQFPNTGELYIKNIGLSMNDIRVRKNLDYLFPSFRLDRYARAIIVNICRCITRLPITKAVRIKLNPA